MVNVLVLTAAVRAATRAALSSTRRIITNRPYSQSPRIRVKQTGKDEAASTIVAPRLIWFFRRIHQSPSGTWIFVG